jgi:ferrous iron transport protein B
MTATTTLQVALVGNPNAGKSSVFNLLTGLRQKTGNFPGVTVEQKSGQIYIDGQRIKLIDLPGTYSLYPNALDEWVSVDILTNPHHPDHPDVVVYVADVQQINRHLLLLTQLIDLGKPILVVLTMTDLLPDSHQLIERTEQQFGLPTVALNGRTGDGLDMFQSKLAQVIAQPGVTENAFVPLQAIEEQTGLAFQNLDAPHIKTVYHGLVLAHHVARTTAFNDRQKQAAAPLIDKQNFRSLHLQITETMRRYDRIERLMPELLTAKRLKTTFTERLDTVLTHPIAGPIIFIGIMLAVFQAIFTLAEYPMQAIETSLAYVGNVVGSAIGDNPVGRFIEEGVFAGLSGVLVFIPQIAILFALLTMLEEIGYMARAVYLFDKFMQRFGLNGRSIVSLIAGGACAIPAIMSTRTISNKRERLLTIFITPLIPCSARLPVFFLLVGFLVPNNQSLWGIIGMQSLALTAFYAAGILMALAVAMVISQFIKDDQCSYLMLELPNYKLPHWRNVATTVWGKVHAFVTEAGKMILIISMALWVLSAYGPPAQIAEAQARVEAQAARLNLPADETKAWLRSETQRHSFAGYIGRFIEPAIAPLGYDWKIGIALISSFLAREVFVGTMNIIYNANTDNEDYKQIRAHMAADRRPDGSPLYSFATALSLLMFYLFALQCVATVAVVRRETGSWKWPLLQFVFMGALAWIAAFIVFQVFS